MAINMINVKYTTELNRTNLTVEMEWSVKQWIIYRYIIVISSFVGIILSTHVLYLILSNRRFRNVVNMFHVNIFITNLCAMLTGIGIEFPILIGVLDSLNDVVCEANLTIRRMFMTITLTHFIFLALNRSFAICLPHRKCLVSKKAFAIKSIIGYGLPIVNFAGSIFFIEMHGSDIIYSAELKSCIHVTLDDGAAR